MFVLPLAAGELVLAERGSAASPVAVRLPVSPTESQRFAAEELADYAKRMTGAPLCAPVIIEEPGADLGDEGFRLYVKDGALRARLLADGQRLAWR